MGLQRVLPSEGESESNEDNEQKNVHADAESGSHEKRRELSPVSQICVTRVSFNVIMGQFVNLPLLSGSVEN